MHIYWHKNSKINKTSNFFDDFFAPKTVFWKKHYWGAPVIDCFEPILRFLVQFCFQKHRSDTWNRIGMFSELSGHSALLYCMKLLLQPSNNRYTADILVHICSIVLAPTIASKEFDTQYWAHSIVGDLDLNGKKDLWQKVATAS